MTVGKRENEKKRLAKREEKLKRKENRKTNKSSIDDMIAYVDEYGMISSTPPEENVKKKEINLEEIMIATPKKEDEEPVILRGRVEFFNESRGFGFIKDLSGVEKYFFHVNNVVTEIKEGNVVTFDLERGIKGMNAVNICLETHDSFDGKSELCHIALKESITHPRNTEDGDNSLHPGREYRTLRCFDSIRLGYYKDDSGCRQHYDLDNGGHTERDDFSIDEETGTHTFKRSEKDDKSSCQYKDEYGKHGGTFVLDIFNLYLLVIEKTFFQAFLIFGILYQFLADFHGE